MEVPQWGPFAPVGVLGDNPPKAEAVCRHCLQILTAEMIRIRKFCTIHLLTSMFYGGGGLSDILGTKPPRPIPGAATSVLCVMYLICNGSV